MHRNYSFRAKFVEVNYIIECKTHTIFHHIVKYFFHIHHQSILCKNEFSSFDISRQSIWIPLRRNIVWRMQSECWQSNFYYKSLIRMNWWFDYCLYCLSLIYRDFFVAAYKNKLNIDACVMEIVWLYDWIGIVVNIADFGSAWPLEWAVIVSITLFYIPSNAN